MKKIFVLILLLSLTKFAFSQLPTVIQTELTTHLDNLSTGWVQESVDKANQIFIDYQTIEKEHWANYFSNYFANKPFTDDLFLYLEYPSFYWLSEQAQANLQHGLFTSFFEIQDSLFNLPEVISIINNEPSIGNSLANMTGYLGVFYAVINPTTSQFHTAIAEKYLTVVQNYPHLFHKNNIVEVGENNAMGFIRSQVHATLSTVSYLYPNFKEEIGNGLGLYETTIPLEQKLWEDFNLVVSHNGRFDNSQIQAIHQIFSIVPTNLHQVVHISVFDVVGNIGAHRIKAIGRFNTFDIDIGGGKENGFPSEVSPHFSDGFTLVILHELNHSVDGYGLCQQNHLLCEHKDRLLQSAGTNQSNFLRSMFEDGFFTNAPQEFIASISNMYFANTDATLEVGLKRFEEGRPQPLDQFLLMANIYAIDSDSTIFIEFDELANFKIRKLKVDKDNDGYIFRIYTNNNCYHEFVLDENKKVTNVIIPNISEEIPNNGIDEDCDGADLITTSIHEIEGKKVTIFPNPVQHQLNIQLESVTDLNYELLDLAGRIIFSNKSFNTSTSIDLSALVQGTYLLRISTPLSTEVIMEKVIKIN